MDLVLLRPESITGRFVWQILAHVNKALRASARGRAKLGYRWSETALVRNTCLIKSIKTFVIGKYLRKSSQGRVEDN